MVRLRGLLMTTASFPLSKVVAVFTRIANAHRAAGHATTVERRLGLDMFSASDFAQLKGGVFSPAEDSTCGFQIAAVHLPVVPAQPSTERIASFSAAYIPSLLAVSMTDGETFHQLTDVDATLRRGRFGNHRVMLSEYQTDTVMLRIPSLADGALLMRRLDPKAVAPLLSTTVLLAAGLWLTEPEEGATQHQQNALREGNRAREKASGQKAGTRWRETAYAYGETSPLAAAVCHWRSARWFLTTPQPYGQLAQLAHELQLAHSRNVSGLDPSFSQVLYDTFESVQRLLTKPSDG